MTTHKRQCNRQHYRQPARRQSSGFNTNKLLDTTVKVVEIGAITSIAVALIKH